MLCDALVVLRLTSDPVSQQRADHILITLLDDAA